MAGQILVYGSYGYTGGLIARFAKETGVDVVLSGRNAVRLREQSERYGLEYVPGFQTPSTAYGKDVILELPGAERQDD